MKGIWKISSFGDVLRSALERRGIDRQIKEHEVIQRWSEIAGEMVARHSTPVRMRNGILWLSVQDATWRMELHSMRGELARKINAAAGDELVREIRVR